MQSRLTRRSYWLFSAANNLALPRGIASGATRRTANPAAYSDERKVDPAVFSGNPEGTQNVAEAKPAKQQAKTEFEPSEETVPYIQKKETVPFVPPKPPYAPSPRLVSIGVNHPVEPITQQKRNNNSVTAPEDVSCAGLDGSPWPTDKENEQRDEQELIEDDKDYYKHHKPSPISEIEVADTRKPITRATDGTADEDADYDILDVIGWRPEQLDTAEEALRRATEIWKQNAMRGDPSLPHSRVLRELRGEWF